jgi:type IV secretory pathway VirB4 component
MQDHRTIIDHYFHGSRLAMFFFFLCFYGPMVLKRKNNIILQIFKLPGPSLDHRFNGLLRSWCKVLP